MSAFLEVKEKDYEKVIDFCKQNNIEIKEYDYTFEAMCCEAIDEQLKNVEIEDEELKKEIFNAAVVFLLVKEEDIINYDNIHASIDYIISKVLKDYKK